MEQRVLIKENPKGVEVRAAGLNGIIKREFINKSEIEFVNEFGELESWYFEKTQYKKL